jgi:hypothetical protein
MEVYIQQLVQVYCAIASPMMNSFVTAVGGVYEDSPGGTIRADLICEIFSTFRKCMYSNMKNV